jgi:endonuclease/exonuclease/phosphatase family metal-dependent hydrolase
MNRRLHRSAGQLLKKLADFQASLAALSLVIGTSGCASGRPSPLLVEHPVGPMAQTASNDGLSLKLVTFNIWGLPSWMTGAPAGRYPKIARELERLNPDVILLQEGWTTRARKSAPSNGRWSLARAAGQHTLFQQTGLMTLSRFPIIGGTFYPFSRSAFPDKFVNKGVLKVTVQLPGRQVLNVWNVHLQDGGPPEIRLSQIRELVSRVQEAKDDQIADVIGGDFNCTPESSLYWELANSFGSSLQQLNGGSPFVTWDGLSAKPGAGQTLDYVFVRDHTPFQKLRAVPRVAFTASSLDQRLSDHLGIEAVVDFRPDLTLARAMRPFNESSELPRVAAPQNIYAGGE